MDRSKSRSCPRSNGGWLATQTASYASNTRQMAAGKARQPIHACSDRMTSALYPRSSPIAMNGAGGTATGTETVRPLGVIVDAKPNAVAFYARCDFMPVEAVEGASGVGPAPTPMFLSTCAIQQAQRLPSSRRY